MDRRDFIGKLALGTLVAPRIANAQTARKVYRIGILGLGQTSRIAGPQPQAPDINAFVRGLRELGYVYGEQFVTEPRGVVSRLMWKREMAQSSGEMHTTHGPSCGTASGGTRHGQAYQEAGSRARAGTGLAG